jgi:chromosome segregation ATPase
MRVGVDGHLLAANQAALALMGAHELSDVVGHSLTERIVPKQGTAWQEFAERVWNGAPGSIECDITTVSGAPKSVLFQAVPLPGHPDEVRSLLLTARDMSANRRLEDTLEQQDDVARLTQTLVEHDQLTTLLTTRADAARAEQQRTVALLEEREAEYKRELAVARAQFAAAQAETADLKTSLERRETASHQLVTEQAAEHARLQQAAAAARERALGLEQQAKQLADQRAELDAALQASAADTADLKALLKQHDSVVTELRNKLVNAAAERQRLNTLLEHRDVDTVKALADQKLELKILRENIRSVEPLAAAGRLAIEMQGELQDLLMQVEQRTARLIERCSLDAVDRSEIENLRVETARAASLARQVASLKTKA